MNNAEQVLAFWESVRVLDIREETKNDVRQACELKLKELTGKEYTLIRLTTKST